MFQGAVIGLVTSLTFNLWVVIGKMSNKAGNDQQLPFSTEGCPSEFSNQTILSTTSASLSDNVLNFTTVPDDISNSGILSGK